MTWDQDGWELTADGADIADGFERDQDGWDEMKGRGGEMGFDVGCGGWVCGRGRDGEWADDSPGTGAGAGGDLLGGSVGCLAGVERGKGGGEDEVEGRMRWWNGRVEPREVEVV